MTKLDWNVLDIDYQKEADRIAQRLREVTARELHKRGLVVAISGGIDSSCSVALAVRALGPERVFALILPERDSSDDSAARANILASHLGIRVETVDIAPTLAAQIGLKIPAAEIDGRCLDLTRGEGDACASP